MVDLPEAVLPEVIPAADPIWEAARSDVQTKRNDNIKQHSLF